MRRKRVSQATSRANSSKRSSAAGSRSMQTSVPVGPMRSATRRAWPPPPKVQSTTIVARLRVGQLDQLAGQHRHVSTCHVKKDGQAPSAISTISGVQLVLVGQPLVPIPDLEVVDHANHHDLLLDPPVADERGVERHPAGRVELDVERAAREEARELAALAC